MKLTTTRLLALALFVALMVWVIDAAVGAAVFYDEPFLRLLLHPSSVQLYTHLVFGGSFLLLALSVGVFMRRARRTADENKDMRARYAAILATTSDGALATDAERRITAFSPGAERIFGYHARDVLGKPISMLCPEDLREEQASAWRKILETGSYSGFETERLTKDGRRVPVELTVNLVREESGEVSGTTAVVRDISDRVRSRLVLEEQAFHLEHAQELAHVGSWTFDLDEGSVTASEEAKRIYGLSGHRWTIADVQTIPLPEQRARLDAAFRDLVEKGEPYDVVFSIRRPDGDIRVVHSVARFDERRNRVTGVLQDITEQRAAEEALRRSEERFRSVIEQSSQAIYLLVDDHFELVNPKFCELTGVSAEEAQSPGFDIRELIAPESLRLVEERRIHRLQGEEVGESYEFTIRHRSGSRVQVAASVAGIDYRGHEAVLGFLHDITEQKALEARLEQALRMESLGRLSGGVAHDLNNLLSPILGYAELLVQDVPAGDERKEWADAILQAGVGARDLVWQLLAFSRQKALEMGTVDLNEMLRDFVKLLRRTLRADVRIDMELDAAAPQVVGDRRQFEQVVMNLAVNAQDAMPGGGVLTVRTEEVELDEAFASTHPGSTEGRFTRLSIADTGEGMDAITRRRIFEPFFTTKPKGKGTGLGLATVYGIMKQYGGYIEVLSEQGKGAAFSCYFPVATVTTEAAQVHRTGPAASGGAETVLVVEDESLVRGLVLRALLRQGYQVHQAASAEDALEVMDSLETSIDLLLTDVVLPGLNGRELYHEVHRRSPETRVLFMSGYTGDVITERGVLTDDTFIQKPFSVLTLVARVREILDRRSPGAPGEQGPPDDASAGSGLS